MTLLDLYTGFVVVWLAVPLGWLVILPFRRNFKIKLSIWKVCAHVGMHVSMLTVAMTVIPGWTHPLIVATLFALYLISPAFIVGLGAFESVSRSRLGRAYIMYLNALFTISLIAIMDLIALDPYHYFYSALMQGLIAGSLFIRGAPAVLHGLQKTVMSRSDWRKEEEAFLAKQQNNL